MRYLMRVKVDPEIDGVEPWYYAEKGKVPVSQTDDVVIDMDRPFKCPDCSGTFLLKLDHLNDEWFADKYVCKGCRAVFKER